jgi:hypothetical protein
LIIDTNQDFAQKIKAIEDKLAEAGLREKGLIQEKNKLESKITIQ